MAARDAILGTVAAALIWAPILGRQNSQSASPRDRALATALAAGDTAQAVRLATEALSTPLSLPAGHPAGEVLGPSLRSQLPVLLSNTPPPGPIFNAHLNNLGVALALRGWTDSAAVAFSGAMLVADPRTAGVRWASPLAPGGASRSIQSFQYSSSSPNPVVINIENLSRLLKSGSVQYGGRGPYEFFNGLLETAEKRATPDERLRAMAEVFPPIVSRSLSDALAATGPGAPASAWTFDRAYRSFAQYKGKYLRSLDARRARRIGVAASQSDQWDDRGLYGFDPATRLQAGEVFVDLYLVELGDRPTSLRREYVAVIVSRTGGGQPLQPAGPQVVTLGAAAAVDDAVADLRPDLASPKGREILAALAARLWAPVAAHLPPGTRRVWLSPDGQLGPVPWQALALSVGAASPVTVSIVDSGETIREPRPRPATTSPKVLLVGNLDYGPGELQPLASAADEIKAVEDVVRSGGLLGSVLMGGAVDRSRLLSALPARIVHFATHGEFSPAPTLPVLSVGPWVVLDESLRTSVADDSAMRRAPALDPAALQRQMAMLGEEARRTWKPPTPEQVRAAMEQVQAASRRQPLAPLVQGVLALSGANAAKVTPGASAYLSDVDLAAADLSATDLVVLSACDLGSSSQTAFQGLMSMQGAVVLAGARGLVASLWEVPDIEAAPFMRQFYRNLLVRKLPPAEALREAQRTASVDAAGRPRPPSVWAGWMFFGEGW